jgi:pimeloyl-ACP methyl ester carboxylesterase
MRHKTLSALVDNGFRQVAYSEWGDAANPRVLVCVHGLTRNRRDFDFLAARLAERWRVICPDLPGRGDSDWLSTKAEYNQLTYRGVAAALLARLDVEAVAWLGTSLGGILGMALAALPGSPIRRLVVNDVGPFLPAAGLRRIAAYVGEEPRFDDLAAVEAWLRQRMATFGVRDDKHWRFLAEITCTADGAGKLRLRYDPGIAEGFAQPLEDTSFWPVWDAVTCPTLVLRGAQSDILLAETAQEMTQRGPKAELVEIPDCGHAPMLLEDDQIALIADWLAKE